MGVILDLLKEVPLSAVLQERLREQESKMAALQAENAALKTENAALKAQVEDLQLALQQVEGEEDIHGDECPYCHKLKGELLRLEPHPVFHLHGTKVGYYKCAACDKQYDKNVRPSG